MKSSDKKAKLWANGFPSWLFLVLAIVCATGMWYVVSIRERIEAQLEVNIDYYGIPPNLVVTDGLINKVTVRLRGAETLLRSIPKHRLNWAIDLSSIKKGVTFVPLTNEDVSPALRRYEIVDIQPPRIVITADNMVERSVPVRAIVDSPLAGTALTIENQSISPSTVVVRGPESVVADLTHALVRIPLDPKSAGTTVQQTLPLDTPGLVTAMPSSVRVRYTITSGRTVLSRICKLHLPGDANHSYKIEPSELSILIEVPEALAQSSSYLKKLEANIVPPPLEPGESRQVRVHFRLPEGMTILGQPLEEVTVTRQKK